MSQAGANNTSGGGGAATILTITGNTGGAVGPTLLGNINILGSGGITVTGSPGTNTLTIATTGGGLAWSVVAVNTAMAINNGYIANGAGTLTFLLPAVSPVGSIVRLTGINNATGWQITQAAGQQIFFGTSSTTLGAGGSLTSFATRDSVELVCVVANTTWNCISSIGNITIV